MKQTFEHYDIKILADGTWLHNGAPIRRHNMVKLFSTVLKRDADGVYWLETPVERGRVTVEDAPFVAVELNIASSGKSQNLLFRTNTDEWVTAGKDHPIRMAENGAPYILVRPGLEAKISRAVYYTLAPMAVKDDEGILGVWSNGTFFRLGAG